MSSPNAPGPYVPNYLVQSILVTIFCCLPLGIPAIVFASQVNAKLQAGDIAGAQASSANAKKWTMIALIAGIVFIVLWFLFIGGSIGTAIQMGEMQELNMPSAPAE